MLHHQDQPLNSYGGSAPPHHRKGDKDGNYNFLLGDSEDGYTGPGAADENRNQMRPRNLAPLGRDPNPAGYHHNTGMLSPRSRLPCWSTLEPLPEIDCGDDGFGRVPPDGAEETRMEEEVRKGMMNYSEEKQKAQNPRRQPKSSLGFLGTEEELEEDDDEWADSESESESDLSCRSGSGAGVSSLDREIGGEGPLAGGWGRIGVGEPKTGVRRKEQTASGPARAPPKRRSFLARSHMANLREEGAERDEDEDEDQSSDSDGELPELMDSVWTLRDRERFKAQEMEKHQAQLTMYRRLALIRWVRTLQSRIQEQQNRLQSSFDVILTQRKELLRMGAAAATAAAMANTAPPAAVGQS